MLGCAKVAALGRHLVSYHVPAEYNNANPGGYARFDCGVQVGAYYNSEKRLSAYAGYLAELSQGRVSLWASGAVVTGYPKIPIAPLALVGVRVGPARLGFFPALPKVGTPHLFHLTIERRF